MKDRLLFFLYKLNRFKLFSFLYSKYYELAIKAVAVIIGRLEFVENLYLKGSYNEGYFVPVISDLDFLLTGELTEKNKRIVANRIKLIHIFFPFVSDYDFYTNVEMDYLRNLSGIKYFQTIRWKCLKGTPIGFSYRFYPRKFYVDIVHEIYFQFVWVFNNLKNRKIGDPYRSLCIQRQYDKVKDLLDYLKSHSSFAINEKQLKPSKEWGLYSNEEIIIKFNDLILESEIIKQVHKTYKDELRNIDFNEVFRKKYYKEELVLVDDNLKYTGKLHYFTKRNFELFYLTGCIDSYVIHEWFLKTNDRVGALYFEGLYFCRLIEGRSNRKHNREYFKFNLTKAMKLKDTLLDAFPSLVHKIPRSYIGQKVLITAFNPEVSSKDIVMSYKKSILKLGSKFKEEDLLILNMYITVQYRGRRKLRELRFLLGESFQNISIYGTEIEQDLWQREALYMIGVHWCFGANIIILSDNFIKIQDRNWLKALSYKLTKNEFVLGYSGESGGESHNKKAVTKINSLTDSCISTFLWGAKYENWITLNSIGSMSYGINTNETFYYQLRGSLPLHSNKVLTVEDSKLFVKERTISQVDMLIEKNTPSISVDEFKLTEIFSREIIKKVNLGPIGLYNSESDNKPLFEYKYYINEFSKLDKFGQMNKLSSYQELYKYSNNSSDHKYTFRQNEESKLVVCEDYSLHLVNDFHNKTIYIRPSAVKNKISEISIELDWAYDIQEIEGIYYVCCELKNLNWKNINLELKPKDIYLHGSDVLSEDGGKVYIPVLLEKRNRITLSFTLQLENIDEKSISIIGCEKVNKPIDYGYEVLPHKITDLEKISFNELYDRHYLFIIKYKKPISNDFYFTSGTKIIWPVTYLSESEIHYLYLEKSSDYSEVILRNINDDFSDVLDVKVILYTLTFNTLLTSKSIGIQPTSNFTRCKPYLVDINHKIILEQKSYNGFYFIPIKFVGEFPISEGQVEVTLSPNGVSSFGVCYSSNVYSEELLLPVYLSANSEELLVNFKYKMSWTRDIEFLFLDPIKICEMNSEYSYYCTLHRASNKNIHLGVLSPGCYRVKLKLNSTAECNLKLVCSNGMNRWPLSYTSSIDTHYYNFSVGFDVNELFLVCENLDHIDIEEMILFKSKGKELKFWKDYTSLSNLYDKKISSKKLEIKSKFIKESIDHDLVLGEMLPLDCTLESGEYELHYCLKLGDESSFDVIKLSHGPLMERHNYFSHVDAYSTNRIVKTLVVSEPLDTIKINLAIDIKNINTMTLEILEIKKIDNEKLSFEYFKKVEYKVGDTNSIGKIYREKYKIIFNFVEEVQGVIHLKSNNSYVWFPTYTGKNNIHVIYFNSGIEFEDLEFEFEGIKSDQLISIDVLKEIKNHSNCLIT